MKQNTLHTPTQPITGTGLHTGHNTTVKILPAEPNTGIVLRRTDLTPAVDIPVNVQYVTGSARNTSLQKDEVTVATVEHLLSALHGMQVDNAIIDINNDEVPILDGSAIPWLQLLQAAGVQQQEAERHAVDIPHLITMQGDRPGVEYIALPYDGFRVTTIIDFNSAVVGTQVAEYNTGCHSYEKDIAPSRTFVFLHEILPLLENGLIKGGALSNAVVYVDAIPEPAQMKHLADLFHYNVEDLRVENGVLNISPARFINEPARHKTLDFMGDILLTGVPLRGHFIIRCPGHKNNAAFAALLRKELNIK